MLANSNGIEGVNFLTQSPVRIHIMELLDETDGVEKQELRAQIDAARTTVQRNLDALVDQNWVEHEHREYAITPLGEAVFRDVSTAVETVHLVDRLGPFLRWFPDDDLEFDIRALAEASITVSTTTTPYAPIREHITFLEEADRVRCLLPAVARQPMQIARNCIVRHDQPHEAVFSVDLEPTLSTEREYTALLADMLDAESYDAFVSRDVIPYYLGISDDCVQIGVEDDAGIPQAIVETDATEIREWAEQTYQSYRSQAEPLSLPADSPAPNITQ